jgi:hypothetical protein
MTLFGAVFEALGVVGLVEGAGVVDGLGDAEFAAWVEGDGDAPGAPA